MNGKNQVMQAITFLLVQVQAVEVYEIKIEIVARIINPLLLGDKYLTQFKMHCETHVA